MKKSIFIFFILFSFFNVFADELYYKNISKIEMDVLRNDKVIVPIEKSTFKEIPWARTLHGEAPVKETINKPSPKPNNDKPKHKKNNVENLGLKLNGLPELQYVFGTFFIDKNM